MSSGFGVEDIGKLSELSWQVYKALSTASDVFKTLVIEASSMHTVMQLVKESLEQQGIPKTLERGLLGIALTCEAVLHDAQKLVEKYRSLGTTASMKAIDRAGLAQEDVADLRNRMTSATSLLTAFQTTLYGRSHARIVETLETLRKDIRAGNREGSVLSSLAIEDLQSDRQEIWREVMIELEDAGLDPEVIHDARSLITGWFEKTISNGGFDEDPVADTRSEIAVSVIQSSYSDRRLSWTSMNSLALLVPKPSVNDTQSMVNSSANRPPYARSDETSSTSTTRSRVRQKPVARILDNNDIRAELAKLNDLLSSMGKMQSSMSARRFPMALDTKQQPEDADADAMLSEDLQNAVNHEINVRNQKSKSERRILPLPWGWVFDDALGLYRNSITADIAKNLPLLDLWSFSVMSYELVPRCIQFIRHNFKILNNVSQQLKDPVQARVIEEALWAIEILTMAISKFGIFLETSHSPDHIYTEIMLLEEFDKNNDLLQSVSKSDFVLARNVYSALMQQILSSLYAFSLIFGSKDSNVSNESGQDHITLGWQHRQMAKRMDLLEHLLDNREYWKPIESALRSTWSLYSDNSLQFMNRSAKIGSIWSQYYKTKHGAAGDKITIQIYSAVSTIGEQLQKSYLSLDRIGTYLTTPLVPLDTVCYIVKVLVDGILIFRTAEDERFSPLSRFSWKTTRDILATNCQYIEFEIWDVNCVRGLKRRSMARALGRIPFTSPISDVAQFGGKDLNKNLSETVEVEMMSAQSGKPWGTLKVGISWEGRDTVAGNLLAANGFSVEASNSEVLGRTFAYQDYIKVNRKAGVVKS